jgi:hypothetical protein
MTDAGSGTASIVTAAAEPAASAGGLAAPATSERRDSTSRPPMGCERQGGRSRNPAMCGDIAVMLIPMPRGVGLGSPGASLVAARRGALNIPYFSRVRKAG